MRTLVIQSHRTPLPQSWLRACIESVQAWSRHAGYDYRWIGDELFEGVSQALRKKTQGHLPMTADLARLQVLQATLNDGYERAVWIDSDVLIFAPERLRLDDADHLFGREVWIQSEGAPVTAPDFSCGSSYSSSRGSSHGQNLRSIRKVHNAFMCFTAHSPVLPFYTNTAMRLLERHRGSGLAPQFIGPKLLTALHNVAQFNVLETAAMLPPLVAQSLMEPEGGAKALKLFQQRSTARPAALNLCGSLTQELQALAVDLPRLIDQLMLQDIPWPGISHA